MGFPKERSAALPLGRRRDFIPRRARFKLALQRPHHLGIEAIYATLPHIFHQVYFTGLAGLKTHGGSGCNIKAAAIGFFTLKTQGKDDGWTDKDRIINVPAEIIDKVAEAFHRFASSRPAATIEDKVRWLGTFAEKAKVEPHDLAKRVGIDPAQKS